MDRETLSRVDGDRRDAPLPSWEVFVRGEKHERLAHVGSVAATDAPDARDRASTLFGTDALDIWVCRAESVERFSRRSELASPPTASSGGDDSTEEADATRPTDGGLPTEFDDATTGQRSAEESG